MADSVLVDNDIVLKMCCYDTVDELIGCIVGGTRSIHVLGVLQFVLAKAINKGKKIANKQRAADCLTRILESVALIEPNLDELELAAELEEVAQSSEVDLDGGESQLLAVLIKRSAILLLTGDKRAIRAIEPVVKAIGFEKELIGRVACLEQVVMELIGRHGAEMLHPRVCSEPAIDASLAICFSCASGFCNSENIVRALLSYIRDVRSSAPSILVDSDDLSTVIT